jgi:DNA modification methylase
MAFFTRRILEGPCACFLKGIKLQLRRRHRERAMPKSKKTSALAAAPAGRPSAVVDTRVIYCGDNLEQLKKLPDACVDLVYIDPPFNSNRNYEVFWGERQEKRAFEDRHASTQAYIDFMRPRCVELHRVLKETGSLYFHCDWHASHYVKVMLDQIFGENQFQNEIVWKRSTAHSDSKQGRRPVFLLEATAGLYLEPALHAARPRVRRLALRPGGF